MSAGFARDLTRVAVAQICQSLGFAAGTSSALDALVDIFRRYVEEIGSLARGYSEHAGRADANLIDVLLALDSLGVGLKDLIDYCENAEQLPFAKAELPLDFPAKIAPKPVPQLQDEIEPHPASVPDYLPQFPPKHTYRETPVVEEFKEDIKKMRQKKAKGKRQVESSLNQLAAKFTTRSVYNYDVTAVATNKTEEKNILSNPWLQRPQPAGSQAKPSATPIPSQVVQRSVAFSVTDTLEGGEQRQLKTRLDIDEGEKAKKKQKVEKILSGELQPEEPDEKASTAGGDEAESMQGGDSPVSSAEEEDIVDEQSNATSMND